jgi:DNA-binding transcriptional MerR regulator
MKKAMFLRDELLVQARISDQELNEWERTKLVKSDGVAKDKTRFYSRDTLERVKKVKRLMSLGYQPEQILKIIKKVGLPTSGRKNEGPKKLHEYLTVGDLADRVGISARAVKHWEDKGIIEPDMRSEGGFRLYSEAYIYLCQLIRDLQLFGYSLEEIKLISDLFRNFLALSREVDVYQPGETMLMLDEMSSQIQRFEKKLDLFKTGIARWENLLKGKKKELSELKGLTRKRQKDMKRKSDA